MNELLRTIRLVFWSFVILGAVAGGYALLFLGAQ